MKGFVAAGLVLALAGACASPGVPTRTAVDVARQEPAAGAPVGEVAQAVTALGYRLSTSAFPAGSNAVLSPLSIAYAFAMARAGAGGETAAQLDRFFAFPAAGLHDAFNAISRQVVTAQTPPANPRKTRTAGSPPEAPVVCVGNALFPQRSYPIGEQFLHTLAAQYGTGVHPVDFHSDAARKTIDDWARQQTAGRVKRVFDHLDPQTKLVIANTVYLRADWATAFAEDPTTTEPFTRLSGSRTKVPTMHLTAQLRYASGPGWQAVELPYAGGQLAMWILLPAAGKAPGPLLSPQSLAAVAGGLQPRQVGVALPKWDFASDLNLVAELTKLGLTAPFTGAADFSGISRGLFIGQAIHRANISVDEWGTEAAAVTALGFPDAAMAPPRIKLAMDHPFAFAIVHTPTGVPLFMGQVADPSAS